MPSVSPTLLGLEPSFGFGDRLGSATPGHLEAYMTYGAGICPIFAQQSIREMDRTGRTPQDVICDAAKAISAEGFSEQWGADADHLKTLADVDSTVVAGYTFFTIDPSDYVDEDADDYAPEILDSKFHAIQPEIGWVDSYLGRTVRLRSLEIEFNELTVRRAAVKYGRAINHSRAVADHIRQATERSGGIHEIELSVDETPQPTSFAEHFIIADQCLESGMNLVSLAPRYIGVFEKGIDYRGDLEALEKSLNGHMEIVRALGPYKLSLHSGSDKLSIYPLVARATGGLFHVKTAGTSYLEALRVVAQHDVALFRRIIDFSRCCFEADRATYHISSELELVPPAEDIASTDLESVYLDRDCGRQVLHVTFGSVLTDVYLGPAIREILHSEPTTHQQVLTSHFEQHLCALRAGM
jgi:hypothetical protein